MKTASLMAAESVLAHILITGTDDLVMTVLGDIAGDPERPSLAEAELIIARRSDQGALAVAAFGYSGKAVRVAVERGRPACVVEAALSNRYLADPPGWAGTALTEAEMAATLAAGSAEVMRVLGSNPALSPKALMAILGHSGPAAGLPVAAYAPFLESLAKNPAFDDLFDLRGVFPDSADRVDCCALLPRLATLLPVEDRDADSLSTLLLRLVDSRGDLRPDGVPGWRDWLGRWRPDTGPRTSEPRTSFLRLRLALALYSADAIEIDNLRQATDPALRAAWAALQQVTDPDDLESIRRTTEDGFYLGMPYNPALYTNPSIGSRFASSCGPEHTDSLMLYVMRARERMQRAEKEGPITRADLDAALKEAVLFGKGVASVSPRDTEPKHPVMTYSPRKEGDNWIVGTWAMLAAAALLVIILVIKLVLEHAL